MTMKTTTTVLALALLAGCAQTGYWNHAHGDPYRFKADAQQCVYEAAAATSSVPAALSLTRGVAQDIETGVRRAELERLCMQARGYFWVQH